MSCVWIKLAKLRNQSLDPLWSDLSWAITFRKRPQRVSFNPVQTGGGAIVPALTLDVYNFFHKQAKPTKLGDFS